MKIKTDENNNKVVEITEDELTKAIADVSSTLAHDTGFGVEMSIVQILVGAELCAELCAYLFNKDKYDAHHNNKDNKDNEESEED